VQPRIDVLVVLHNCKGSLPGLIASLRNIRVPVAIYFLDNKSRDGTPEALSAALENFNHPVRFNRSLRNNGFARGINLLARMGSAEFMFILNPDTEFEPDVLESLLAVAESDPRAGICEARQTPHEHPKAFDPVTGETSWCSGAAALIRRRAFEEADGFEDRLFFMYCEDVDLSWRMWLTGWRCIYVRDAVVRHYTQDLTRGKRRTLGNYFTFRNSLFLFYRFGSGTEWRVVRRFLRSRFLSTSYSLPSRILFGFALIDHIRYIPYLIRTRDTWSDRKHHWVRFEETSLSH